MNHSIINSPSSPATGSRAAIAKSYCQIFDLANTVTLVGLICGLFAIAAASQSASQSENWAMLGLMAAGGTDGLDGWIARRQERTEWQRAIGAQLDSFVDLCCFGWVPMVILGLLGFRQPIDYAVMAFYLICAVLRLAIFNCVGLQVIQQRQYFIGLPVTSIALILPIAWLLVQPMADPWFQELWLMGVVGAIAILMVAPLYIPKPQGRWAGFIAMILGAVALIYLMG